ncbi:hypothetical protein [Lacimicrobium alkaliphilum]|uniref:Uncharacterized protein n=1 Tax=Lacimicrobium alkaliphilum TaxID=1526571 RepID=A0A0U2JI45_9ALTE|nr:hypothetical protein [Lacimicrobium alkaliphilum]ALS96886.1 hypothetical protein AT746_00405 [Lacimicrobium alkaliphilum]
MDNSDYIALGSAVIALAAFGVAIWQGHISRQHNILSVRPRFHIDKSYIEGLHYRLESQGLGPGVVREFAILVNEQEITDPTEDPWPDIFKALGVHGINYDFHIPAVGSTHAPNTSRQLLSVTFANISTDPNVIETIDQAINFRIKFKSLYENEMFSYKGGEDA